MKKRFVAFLLMILTVWICSVAVLAAESEKKFAPIQEDAAANAAQVVIFVEFSDTTEEESGYYEQVYTGEMTRLERLTRDLNGVDDQGMDSWLQNITFRNYIRTISDNQKNIVSYFPQMYVDGTMFPIRTNLSVAEYTGNYALKDVSLITQAMDILREGRPDIDAGVFDKNGDGAVDNLLIVPLIKSRNDVSENFASHAGVTGTDSITMGSQGNTKSIVRYTVVPGGGDPTLGIDGFSANVAAHEYLHTLEFADLYRYSGSGSPVGFWDIMSKAQFTWPLAYARQQQGWTTIPEVNLNSIADSYTLGDHEALVIKPAISSHEFFVAEFRKKNESPGFDKALPASGLIVYRVCEDLRDEGNKSAEVGDYIYIFRPGETGIKDSAGDIDRAAICAGAYTSQNDRIFSSSVGSQDPSNGISDGAICYSDGTNSGLKITALSQQADQITFKIEYQKQEDAWSAVTSSDGTAPFTNISNARTSMTSDGSNIYAAAETEYASTKASVYSYDGSDWQDITGDLAVRNVSLVWYNGKLHALGSDLAGSKVVLMAYTGGSWTTAAELTSFTGITEIPSVENIGGTLYVMVYDNYQTHKIYRVNEGVFEQYGNALPAWLTGPVIAEVGGSVCVAAGSIGQTPWETSLYGLNGSNWIKRLSLVSDGAANAISSAGFGGKTYLLINVNSTVRLHCFAANGTLETTNTLGGDVDASLGGTLYAATGNLYLGAASYTNGICVYVIREGNVNDLIPLGGTAYKGCSDISLTAAGSSIYVAASDTGSSLVALRSRDMAAGDSAIPAPGGDNPGSGENPGDDDNPPVSTNPEPTPEFPVPAATKEITMTVVPESTVLKSVSNPSKKKLKITWKRNSKVNGYQIQYSAKKDFSSSKTVTIKKNRILKKTVSKSIKKGKIYYVRIRTYKTVDGTKYYSGWSKVKKIKVKK